MFTCSAVLSNALIKYCTRFNIFGRISSYYFCIIIHRLLSHEVFCRPSRCSFVSLKRCKWRFLSSMQAANGCNLRFLMSSPRIFITCNWSQPCLVNRLSAVLLYRTPMNVMYVLQCQWVNSYNYKLDHDRWTGESRTPWGQTTITEYLCDCLFLFRVTFRNRSCLL